MIIKNNRNCSKCIAILELDNKQLTLSYMPRGNILKYVRLTDEEVFNKSGGAKAIESKSDLWQVYNNETTGIGFKYPHNVTLRDNPTRSRDSLQMTVKEIDVDTITEDTLGFDKRADFYNTLVNGTADPIAQEWYDAFDKIVDTIELE